MKITGGKFRGRAIKTTGGVMTRPLTGIIREAIFNIFAAHISDTEIADIFCGFGIFGLESLSREASHITFIERDRKVCRLLQQNINTLNVSEKTRILSQDVFGALEKLAGENKKFDLVFADPPFEFSRLNELQEPVSKILSPSGLFLLRISEHYMFKKASCFQIVQQKEYLPSILVFMRHADYEI